MRTLISLATLLVVSVSLGATAQPKELLVALKFTPQESVRVASAALPQSVLDRSVEISVSDARTEADPRVIGAGTDDDDRPFPITSSVQVPQFVNDAVVQIAGAYTFKKSAAADRKLNLRITRFYANEKNQAFGSTYTAQVHLAYVLLDAGGTVLTDGASSGNASRYGRDRSGPNVSEVLSDALKDAFVKVLGDQALLEAWKTGTAAAKGAAAGAASPAKESVEERLIKLNDLLKKGLITEEEYKTKRAEILKDA